MNLQYISDNKGKITGVFIAIHDWKYLKDKYREIEQEENEIFEVPRWQKQIISQRLKDYDDNPENVLDWDHVQKDIEREYGFWNRYFSSILKLNHDFRLSVLQIRRKVAGAIMNSFSDIRI